MISAARWASSPPSPRWAPRRRRIAAAVENILYFGGHAGGEPGSDEHAAHSRLWTAARSSSCIIDEIAMKLFRKKIPEKYEMAVNTAGFVALMGFMLVVTFNDVFKLFG